MGMAITYITINKTLARILFVAALSFTSTSVFANDFTFQFEAGAHTNYLDADDYYKINTHSVSNKSTDLQNGFDLGVLLHFDRLPTETHLGFAWNKTSGNKAYAASFCNGQPCTKATSLEFHTLEVNAHHQKYVAERLQASIFAGISHVWVKGKIKQDAWSDGAFGAQIGSKAYFLPDQKVQPFVGFKLMLFELETQGDTINLTNWSVMVGARF